MSVLVVLGWLSLLVGFCYAVFFFVATVFADRALGPLQGSDLVVQRVALVLAVLLGVAVWWYFPWTVTLRAVG